MPDLRLNETPVRTAKNFNCNNIIIKDLEMQDGKADFNSVLIDIDNENIKTSEEILDVKLTYGLGNLLEEQIRKNANKKIKLHISGVSEKESVIEFDFNEENRALIDNIEIIAEEGSKANIFIKYSSSQDKSCNNTGCANTTCSKQGNSKENETNRNVVENGYYHNGSVRVYAKQNSDIKVTVINLLNEVSQNFLSIENEIDDNANLDFCIVDFGGKNSITNYFSNLVGEASNNELNSIYLGKGEQLFDLNYIGTLRGKKSNMNIEVQGALNGNSRKHFKGTLDFKRGAKKSKGNENEFCMLLSDTAKAIALPMLLCEEEDVEGNHSTAAGKLGNKELFYIMSRGFTKKEAMKLIVRAKFNKILDTITKEDLKNEILREIDNRLD